MQGRRASASNATTTSVWAGARVQLSWRSWLAPSKACAPSAKLVRGSDSNARAARCDPSQTATAAQATAAGNVHLLRSQTGTAAQVTAARQAVSQARPARQRRQPAEPTPAPSSSQPSERSANAPATCRIFTAAERAASITNTLPPQSPPSAAASHNSSSSSPPSLLVALDDKRANATRGARHVFETSGRCKS